MRRTLTAFNMRHVSAIATRRRARLLTLSAAHSRVHCIAAPDALAPGPSALDSRGFPPPAPTPASASLSASPLTSCSSAVLDGSIARARSLRVRNTMRSSARPAHADGKWCGNARDAMGRRWFVEHTHRSRCARTVRFCSRRRAPRLMRALTELGWISIAFV